MRVAIPQADMKTKHFQWVASLLISSVTLLAMDARCRADDGVKPEIERLELEMQDALTTNNMSRFGQYLAPDFKVIDPEGNVHTKDQLMQILRSGRLKLHSYKLLEMDIRSLAADSIVVTGEDQTAGVWDGKTFDYQDRFTDIFSKSSGKWLLVSTHITRVHK